MKKQFCSVVAGVFIIISPLIAVEAQAEERISVVNSDWSFGLQAAPQLFGLSLRHYVNDLWQLQGVISPRGDDSSFGVRVLRTSTRKKYWQSYLFSGIAAGNDSEYHYENTNSSDNDEEYTKTVLTAGLGVEWAWKAKNPSLPPMSWSLELGLGYSVKNYDSDAFSNNEDLFLAAGLGIHYHFE